MLTHSELYNTSTHVHYEPCVKIGEKGPNQRETVLTEPQLFHFDFYHETAFTLQP